MLAFACYWGVVFCSSQHCCLLVQRTNHIFTTSEITIHNSMPELSIFFRKFELRQLLGQSLWEGCTLLAQLSRVGRGWWKHRGHPGVNATPPAMFWRGLPGALALLPTGWAACRREGRRQGPGQRAQRLGWMMCERMRCRRASRALPNAVLRLQLERLNWTPARLEGRERKRKALLWITGNSELEREAPAPFSPTCLTCPASEEFGPRRQTCSVMGLALHFPFVPQRAKNHFSFFFFFERKMIPHPCYTPTSKNRSQIMQRRYKL